MLTDLIVSDLGVIEHAEVDLEDGSTALTGETGAGKTLVIAAVSLLLGDRADRTLVRAGAPRARVEGRFVVPGSHPVRRLLEEHGLLEGDRVPIELVVSRVIESDAGASKARLNGRIVTLSLLQEVCGSLVEIAGQHAHQRIGDARWQRMLLDRMSGPAAVEISEEVAALVARASELNRRAEAWVSGARSRAREIDVLKYEIDEITKAELRSGEAAELHASIRRLEHAEGLAVGLAAAASSLHGEAGAEESIGDAEATISKLTGYDPALEPTVKRLEAVRYEIGDIAADLRARIEAPDPRDLEPARERLQVIDRVLRKYGSSESEVLAYLASAQTRLVELEAEENEASSLTAEAEALTISAEEKARRLSRLRREAIPRFETAVTERLVELAMPDAVFKVELEARELFAGGVESPIFMLSANPGEPAKPLRKVASGGELARAALALQLIATSDADDRPAGSLIFDEVDAGVGGTAARAVGRCLAELSKRSDAQVIVVTHLPQVAACTDHHLKVTKSSTRTGSRALVTRLEGDSRVEEISRMLAGMPESSTAQDHARELLEEVVR